MTKEQMLEAVMNQALKDKDMDIITWQTIDNVTENVGDVSETSHTNSRVESLEDIKYSGDYISSEETTEEKELDYLDTLTEEEIQLRNDFVMEEKTEKVLDKFFSKLEEYEDILNKEQKVEKDDSISKLESFLEQDISD